MSTLNSETEYELENELSLEAEGTTTSLPAQEAELFNHLAAMADRGGQSQALRRVALSAAREAMRGAARRPPAVEGELELELENELENELEFELELDPRRRLDLEAELEHLAHAASEAQSEHEAAEQFLPLIPMAAKLALPLVRKALPGLAKAFARQAPRVLKKLAPSLSRGIGRATRALYRNPSTRSLVKAMPKIAVQTIQSIGGRLARGQRITPRLAAQVLAQQTARTLGSPRRLHQCHRRSVAADRHYHQRRRTSGHAANVDGGQYNGSVHASTASSAPRRPRRAGASNCRQVILCDACRGRR